MRKVALAVMISLLLAGSAFGFEMNQESLQSGYFMFSHEPPIPEYPQCEIFYPDQESDEWDFYCELLEGE